MPFGAMRHGYTFQPAAAGGATFSVKNSLTGVNAAADTVFRHYAAHYLGDKANGDPCFAWVFPDTTNSNNTSIVAFSVSQTDGSLTIGSVATNSEPTNYGLSLSSQQTGAGTRLTSGWVAEGIIGYYNTSLAKMRVCGYSVNLSTLATTFGTAANTNYTTGAGNAATTYVGNDHYWVSHRSTTAQQRANELWSWNGSTLTNQQNFLNTSIFDGGGDFNAAGFVNSGSQYRAMIAGYGNNLNGTNHATVKFNGSVGTDASLTPSTSGWFDGATYNGCDAYAINLNNSSKAIHFQPSSGRNSIKAVAIDATWNSGNTAPSNSLGSIITLTGTDYSPIGFGIGSTDDEAYYYYDDGGTLSYRPITATGTSLTQGSAVTTTLSLSTNVGTTRWECAKSGSGDYLVGVVDSTTGNVPDIFALKIS